MNINILYNSIHGIECPFHNKKQGSYKTLELSFYVKSGAQILLIIYSLVL